MYATFGYGRHCQSSIGMGMVSGGLGSRGRSLGLASGFWKSGAPASVMIAKLKWTIIRSRSKQTLKLSDEQHN